MKFLNSLDPKIAATLENLPAALTGDLEPDDLPALRGAALERDGSMAVPHNENVRIETLAIPRIGEDGETPLRIYTPLQADKSGKRRGILYIHGGGFFAGDVVSGDPLLESLADEIGAVIVSVDYRLAPEHKFPAAFNDAYQALLWTDEKADELGIDRGDLVVFGVSAGSCLAAGITLKAVAESGPAIAKQVLVIPVLDDRMETPSSYEVKDPRVWNRDIAIKAWDWYLGERSGELPDYAAPARMKAISGQPKTVITVEDHDILRDEGIDYAQRLMQNGVPVELRVFPGTFHGSFGFVPDAEVSQKHLQFIRDELAS